MFKLLIGVVGLVEALYPDRFISVLTKLSYDYEGERPTAKPWVVTAARIEGLVLLGVAVWAAIKSDWTADADETSTDTEETDTLSESVDRI